MLHGELGETLDDGGQLRDDEVQSVSEEDLNTLVLVGRHGYESERTKSALSVT